MKPNGKKNPKFPAGWDAARVQKVIDHYEHQSDEERLAEIQDAGLADSCRRFAEAMKQFNKTNQSKLILCHAEKGSIEEVYQLFGQDKYGLLNWCGQDGEGVFNQYYEVKISAQRPTEGVPFRPVLCTISKKLKPAMELPRSHRTLIEVWTACGDGVNLELEKRKNGLVIVGVRTTVYAKSIDSETLIDSLIRLNQNSPEVAKSEAG